VAEALAGGRKLLLFGNGGSAADAQHLAAEFVGRFQRERQPLRAIALTTDTSALTAIANDYGYDEVFARQVRALGAPGDVALAISTSGRSPSVLRAVEACRAPGIETIGPTGGDGGTLAGAVEREAGGLRRGRAVLLGMGGHPLKAGLGPVIVDLIERGRLAAVAMNGACLVHDFELAWNGRTSEDVGPGLERGTFGMARETG